MIYLSAAEAKQNFTEFLDKAQKEPITIQRQDQDLVVVLSVLEYQKLTRLLKDEFQKFCDQVGENAEAKGMTKEKLKEIIESDDNS
jgi:prevent-host-death family protein